MVAQNEGVPNITGSVNNKESSYGSIQMISPVFNGAFSGKRIYNSSFSGSHDGCYNLEINARQGETKTNGTLKANNEHKVYGSSDHVTPCNTTIKVWQRVS